MPNKERQLTVTLMGRMLNQLESRMQHTRGTAPPGWADLHSAAKHAPSSKRPIASVAAPGPPDARAAAPPSSHTPSDAGPSLKRYNSTHHAVPHQQMHALDGAPGQAQAAPPKPPAQANVPVAGPTMLNKPLDGQQSWPGTDPSCPGTFCTQHLKT